MYIYNIYIYINMGMYYTLYIHINGSVPLIPDTANMIKCNLRVFGANTMNYSINYFTFLFVSVLRPQAPFSD